MPKVDEKMRKNKPRDGESYEVNIMGGRASGKDRLLRELRKQRILKRSSYLNEVEKET